MALDGRIRMCEIIEPKKTLVSQARAASRRCCRQRRAETVTWSYSALLTSLIRGSAASIRLR
jgi:hypothetical protein